jgi:hypothetical protein
VTPSEEPIMADAPTPPLFRQLLVAAMVAAAAAVGAFVYGHAIDRDLDRHQGWLDAIQTARFMVPSEPPFPDRRTLEGALHTLEIALPEIEAAGVTQLRTVRNGTEAAFKVVNTSMDDSPRRSRRGEAIIELAAALDALVPEVERSAHELAVRRVWITRFMGLLGLITVSLAVGSGLVAVRSKTARDQR